MSQLAFHGGPRAVPEGLIKPWPWVTDGDRTAVMGALDSGPPWRIPFPEVEALTKEWAAYTGRQFCLPCNSGTASLHLAIFGAGMEVGDEVIAPAFTYLGSVSGIVHGNGIPVFVDIGPQTMNIDPTRIEERITDRTKAIIAVDLHGLPADYDHITAIARKHGLVVIEDGAQAHGARYKGKPVGALGDISGCSLNGSKNLSALGEGGLFTTDDEAAFRRAQRLLQFGEVADVAAGPVEGAFVMGFNYRLDNLQAAFTRSQLSRLDEMMAQKVANCDRLTAQLGDIPGLIRPHVPPDRTHTYFFYPLRARPEDLELDIPPGAFRAAAERLLQAEGVNARRWQTAPLPEHAMFYHRSAYGRRCPWSCPHARPGVEHHPEDYPEATRAIQDCFVIGHSTDGLGPPNGFELMDAYAAGIRKVMVDYLDELIQLAREDSW